MDQQATISRRNMATRLAWPPTSNTSGAQPPNSQYHHFIPRFILRNFVHHHDRHEASPKSFQKKSKRWRNKSWKNNEPMIYAINLSKPTAEIVERSISRTFGITDMYRDFESSTNQHSLEEELSKLESRAAQVVSKMRKSFEEGKPDVWITRPERNTLRRFLFIMKYRSSRMHKRFYHEDSQRYSADDREKLLRYMEDKGFKKPVDVWFDNIKGMLELKMDLEDRWIHDFPKRIYPDDAMWFIAHTQMMYLALCTPANQDDEFLLTENAYGIYEGPSSEFVDPSTGKVSMGPYTEFHKFAVISPKLMMVLRSVLLPVLEEDANEEIQTWRDTMFKLNSVQHCSPSQAVSRLADLPITKARNSYSKLVNGRLESLDGRANGTRKAHDKFCFRFFPLVSEHVNKINAIMLHESHRISNIVFKSHAGLQRALSYYLLMPTTHGFKQYDGRINDPGLRLLKKLESLVNKSGSNITAVYGINTPGELNQEQLLDEHEEVWGQICEKSLPKEPTQTMQIYMKIGGSPKTLMKDMEQARRMLNMRIKVDVFTKGLDEDFREETRERVRELFCQLPSQRVWHYLKRVRGMLLGSKIDLGVGRPTKSEESLLDGPEDSIAMVSHIFGNTITLCRLMWYATLKDIEMIKNPDINFDTIITMDEEGAHRMNLQRRIYFGPPGNICDCGIQVLEGYAKFCKDIVRSMPDLEEISRPWWKPEENIEMWTRCMVRDGFEDLMGSKLSVAEFEGLDKALFDVIYPTLPKVE